jgi:amidohydrolase
MLSKAKQLSPRLVELRRAVHRHPEPGFEVHRTAALVARTLAEYGVQVQTGVGKTGVVGRLGPGNGRVVAIRADMDALPIQEINQVDYASQEPGFMHACGHDAHTAMLLGAAMLLSNEKLAGEVRFLFQPSEETFDKQGVSGATAMLADHALDGTDAVIALHVTGTLDTGKIEISPGVGSAAVDTFKATIKGKGGHGAHPNQTVDPFWITSQVLNALYAVPSRRIDPLQPAVLSIGVVRGGSAANIIPDSVYLEGTLRSIDAAVRLQLLDEVINALGIARAMGGSYEVELETGYPSMVNDEGVVEQIRLAAAGLLGADSVLPDRLSMGAEDFSYMAAASPGAMFNLGVRQPGQPSRYLHNPEFDIDENALPIGAAILAESALRLLARS